MLLDWYAQALVDHGDAILSEAATIFGSHVQLTGKFEGPMARASFNRAQQK